MLKIKFDDKYLKNKTTNLTFSGFQKSILQCSVSLLSVVFLCCLCSFRAVYLPAQCRDEKHMGWRGLSEFDLSFKGIGGMQNLRIRQCIFLLEDDISDCFGFAFLVHDAL